MATFREMAIRLGAIRIVEPVIDVAFDTALQNRWLEQEGDNPHGRPWHVSFHASSFPGDDPQACGRYAMYGLMDIPKGGPADRWLQGVAEVGKAVELNIVRAARDAGFLVRSNQQGRSSDPDSSLPQMGFVDEEHWLTGSVDMPLYPFGYTSPHIVEIKTKHEKKIEAMQWGEKDFDPKHRRQLLCSLGLAHENPNAFLHPLDDVTLEPANDGAIYYNARDTDWPGPAQTFEFFFEHDPAFMEQGRAKLAEWKRHFLDGEMPVKVPRKNTRSHPNGPGWQWSQGACKYCPLKRQCKKDYEHGIVHLHESHAVATTVFTRPGYSYAGSRAAVLSAWGQADPLTREEGN